MTVEKTKIESPYIKLDQFLKWIQIAESGAEAKFMIENGQVTVNCQVEFRRGRKLHPGDEIAVGSRTFLIVNHILNGSR